MGRLAANVALRNPDSDVVEFFGPDSDVPSWAEEQITNPNAWADSDNGSEAPPKAGKGSGKDAWADYAAANDVDVPDDASRDDIIAALDAAGVSTE